MSTIRTYTGRMVDVTNFQSSDIDLTDIAHALSLVCRYTGHVPFHYSVAQHCVLGAAYFTTARDKFRFLLHDASEAYIADVAKPFKECPDMEGYRRVEARIQAVIYNRFGFDSPDPSWIHDVDHMMGESERAQLQRGEQSKPGIFEYDWRIIRSVYYIQLCYQGFGESRVFQERDGARCTSRQDVVPPHRVWPDV